LKDLMTGNAAIARGAYENGVTLASAYPGTPSTEILENFCKYEGVYAEWAPNEKVALEVGIGAAMAGVRVLVTMKHVGMNVAADPLLTAAYTGVNGGLVLVCAPVLEPADSNEAKEMTGLALQISEEFDIPVILRTTTRVAHSQGFVETREKAGHAVREYKKDPRKWLMVPAFGKLRRASLTERLNKLNEYSNHSLMNFIVPGDKKVGVITSGISYTYVREVLPRASVLKLGMTYPLPAGLIKKFAAGVERLIVVEELEPYIEDFVRSLGLPVSGKEFFPDMGEFSPSLVKKGFAAAGMIKDEGKDAELFADLPAAPARPPVLCAGCPHRGIFYMLNKMKLVVTGDIGCYTLGGLAPLEGMDSCICMGASIGMSHGIDRAVPEMRGRTVAVIGDSTFLHSGITGLLNVVYNGGNTTVIILDNRTTAMTGHQDHPATGKTLMGKDAPAVDMEALARALGVPRVRTVDPLNLAQVGEAVKEELAAEGPSVIIARRPCVMTKKHVSKKPVTVNTDLCIGCKACLKIGCPAISVIDKVCSIDHVACVGCNLCVQVCKVKALVAAEGGVAGA